MNESHIYQCLEESWGHIKDNISVIFEELGEDIKDKTELVTNPVNKAGFESNYKLHSNSVARTITV